MNNMTTLNQRLGGSFNADHLFSTSASIEIMSLYWYFGHLQLKGATIAH
jgi:hypothetical protein